MLLQTVIADHQMCTHARNKMNARHISRCAVQQTKQNSMFTSSVFVSMQCDKPVPGCRGSPDQVLNNLLTKPNGMLNNIASHSKKLLNMMCCDLLGLYIVPYPIMSCCITFNPHQQYRAQHTTSRHGSMPNEPSRTKDHEHISSNN